LFRARKKALSHKLRKEIDVLRARTSGDRNLRGWGGGGGGGGGGWAARTPEEGFGRRDRSLLNEHEEGGAIYWQRGAVDGRKTELHGEGERRGRSVRKSLPQKK